MAHVTRWTFSLLYCVLACVNVWADEDRTEVVIAGDYFGAGGSLHPGAAIEGDAFVAGGEVTLRATVQGDAVLSGGNVHVGDRVGGDLYAAGGNIVVDAAVGQNARLAGGRIQVTRHAHIGGRVTIAGSNIRMEGRTGGAFTAFGDSVTIDGEIGGGALVFARSLEVGPNARINGRLTYRTGEPPQISPQAVISGGIKESDVDFPQHNIEPAVKAAAWLGALVLCAGLFVIGALMILLIPRASETAVLQLRSRPLAALLLGFALAVCIPVAAVLAMATVIGIPLGVGLMFLWPVVIMLGYVVGALFFGDALAAFFARVRGLDVGRGLRMAGLAVVLVAAIVLTQIPLIGFLLVLALLFAGTGALSLGIRAAV